MSLFIAVRPDEAACEDLQHELERVRRLPAATALQWQPPSRWHITLSFLGDPPDSADDTVAEAIDALSTRAAVLGLRLAGADCFGRQILWVGVERGVALDSLTSLVQEIPRLVRGTGVDLDRKAWRAHLTVARARRSDARALVGPLANYRGPAWRVDEVLLMRSVGGPRPSHQVVHRVPLASVRTAPPR